MFDWSGYLRLARELAGRDGSDPNAEACWRSAVSRAYYCAYHGVKDYVLTYEDDTPLEKEDSHWSLVRVVRGIFSHSKLHRQVAKDLGDLRVARTRADYEPASNLTQATARQAVGDAETVLKLVDELRSRRGSPANNR